MTTDVEAAVANLRAAGCTVIEENPSVAAVLRTAIHSDSYSTSRDAASGSPPERVLRTSRLPNKPHRAPRSVALEIERHLVARRANHASRRLLRRVNRGALNRDHLVARLDTGLCVGTPR